jgi:hypothetical protein
MLAVVTQTEEKSWQVECNVTLSSSASIRVRASVENCVLELQFGCPKYAFREEGCYSSMSRKPNTNVQTVLAPWYLVFQQILLLTLWPFMLVKNPIVAKTPESLHSSHNFMSITRTENFLGIRAGNAGSTKQIQSGLRRFSVNFNNAIRYKIVFTLSYILHSIHSRMDWPWILQLLAALV